MFARPPLISISLAILAGGEGSRMGIPKAHLKINDTPILTHLLHQFRWPGPTLVVTAPGREKPPGHELFTREVTDPVAGQGPLRGILTALDAATTPLVIITTVDMPNILPEHLLWLANTMNAAPAAPFGLLLQRPGPPTRIEPFPSIFHRTAATLIRARLDAGLLSVQSLAGTGEFIATPSPPNWPERVWTNLNRMDDVLQWEKDSR